MADLYAKFKEQNPHKLAVDEKEAVKRAFDYLQIANDELLTAIRHDKVGEAKVKIAEAVEIISKVWQYQRFLDKIPEEQA
jgi:hypothetical protein